MRRLDELAARRGRVGRSPSSRRRAPPSSSAEGCRADAIEFVRQIDMRYVGQSYELTIPAPGAVRRASRAEPLLERFHAEHDRTYGFAPPTEPIECVSLRLTTVGRIAKPPLRPLDAAARRRSPKERRPVYFAEAGGYVDCPIYDRYALPAGGADRRARRSSRSSTRPPSSTRATPSESTTYGNLIIEREDTVSEPYGIVVSKDVMVTMRDGIRLATDLYRPARDGELVDRPLPDDRLHHAVRQDRAPLHRDRRLLRPARLRGRAAGPARPPPLRGDEGVLPPRHAAHRRGRLRHDRVDRRAAVEQRPHRDGRQLVRGITRSAPRSSARRT